MVSNHLSLVCPPGLLETEWVRANKDLVVKNSYTVRELTTGERMNFRVVAVNMAGQSPPALLDQPVTIREIMGEFLQAHYFVYYGTVCSHCVMGGSGGEASVTLIVKLQVRALAV